MKKSKIFNAQEVQAIISGNKTQFREALKHPENYEKLGTWDIKCPYRIGRKIFVKENFRIPYSEICYDYYDARFPSKDFTDQLPKWANGQYDWPLSAQHMKQEQSRLTLLIKEIRVERLSEISEEDCWKEGLEEFADYQDQVKICEMAKRLGECIEDPKPTFAVWWNTTHKKPEEKFEASPWVWVISFEVENENE